LLRASARLRPTSDATTVLVRGHSHRDGGYLPGRRRSRPPRCERFDVAGAATVTGGLIPLVYPLNRATDFGWGSGSTLGLFAASVLMLAAF